MAYAQVSTLISRVQGLRRRMIETAERHVGATDDDYLRELVERAREHDVRLSRFVAEHARNASAAALDTWIQYTEGLPTERDFAALDPQTGVAATGEQIAAAMLALDGRILEVYGLIHEQARGQTTRDFIEDLTLMESQKARDKSRNYQETSDLRPLP